MGGHKTSISIRLLVIFLIFSLAAFEIYAALGLYADGSFFLANILNSNGFFIFYKARAFAQLITQIPIVFALKIGVDNLNILIGLHSFGLIAIPAGLWIAALMLQIKTNLFWLFVSAFSVTYLCCEFFAIGEYNLSYSFTALIASILLRDILGKFARIVLLLSSCFISLTYESMIFLGPLLCLIYVLRVLLMKKKLSLFLKIEIGLSLVFLITSAIISFGSIITPGPGQTKGALENTVSMLLNIHFIYLLLMGFLFTSSLFFKKTRIIFFLAGIISIVYLMSPVFWITPQMNYLFRLLSGVSLAFIMVLSAVCYFLPRIDLDIFQRDQRLVLHLKKIINIINIINSKSNPIPSLVFITAIIPFYIQIIGFYNWGGVYEQEISTRMGFVSIRNTIVANSLYNWFWTNSYLSRILRGNTTGAIILNGSNDRDFQPIDPFRIGRPFPQIDNNALSHLKKNAPFYQHSILLDTRLMKQLVFSGDPWPH